MLIEQGLIHFLAAQASVTDAVGSRIYPVRLPEADPSQEAADSLLPAVTYRRLPETKREPHQKGAGSLVTASYLFRTMAADYPTAKTVAVRCVWSSTAFQQRRRPSSGSAMFGTSSCARGDSRRLRRGRAAVHGDEQGEFAVTQIFEITYYEQSATE